MTTTKPSLETMIANIREQIAYLENIIGTPALAGDITDFGIQALAQRVADLREFLTNKIGVEA